MAALNFASHNMMCSKASGANLLTISTKSGNFTGDLFHSPKETSVKSCYFSLCYLSSSHFFECRQREQSRVETHASQRFCPSNQTEHLLDCILKMVVVLYIVLENKICYISRITF